MIIISEESLSPFKLPVPKMRGYPFYYPHPICIR